MEQERCGSAPGSPPPTVTVPSHAPRVLVVGTDDWAIEQGADALEASGHDVLRCHEPGQPAFPCNALRPGGVCPLTVGFDLVVSMRSRPVASPQQSELGAICG